MRITERTSGDVPILDVAVRITPDDEHGVLKARVAQLVAAGQRRVLLNLSEVPYVDSSGVGEIVSAFISVRNTDSALKILGATERVAERLAISRFDTVFEAFETKSVSLDSFSGRR